MRSICLYDFSEKKQRGQRRKLRALILAIDAFTPFREQYFDKEYDHFHVPCDISFINSKKTNGKIKSAFCQKWIAATETFILKKPKDLAFCKIVCLISEKDLWGSQIIIFYSEEYYHLFWERNSPGQTWLPLADNSLSFAKPRNINTVLHEQGYTERLQDIEEDGTLLEHQNTLWYYGEVPTK